MPISSATQVKAASWSSSSARSSGSFSFTNPSRAAPQRIKVVFDDEAGLHRRNPIVPKRYMYKEIMTICLACLMTVTV
jgi:hypothetical protein